MELLVTWFLSEIADNLNARSFRVPRKELDTTGELSHALGALSGLLGLQGSALLDSVFDDLRSPQNTEALRQAKKQRDFGEYPPYTLMLRHANGGRIPISVIPRPIYMRGEFMGSTAVLVRPDNLLASTEQRISGARGPHCALLIESELHRRQRRYKMAVEAGRVGVWELDLLSGEMYLDSGLKQLLGYQPQEIGNHIDSWIQLVHPDDKSGYLAEIYDDTRNRSLNFEHEHRMLHKNGEIVWMLSRGSFNLNANGRFNTVIGTDLDITALKQAEHAIEGERLRLFDLLERLPAFVCLIAPDYSLRFANRYFKEEFENLDILACAKQVRHSDEPVGLCPPPDVFDTQFLSVWEWECTANGKAYRIFSYPFRDPEGTALILELGTDITQNKRAQEALRASEERYRSIANNLTLGIGVLDKKLRIYSVNKKMCAWFPFLANEEHIQLEMLFQHTSETPHDIYETCELVFRQGTVRELQLSNAAPPREQLFRVLFCPLFNDLRQVEAVIVLAEDITEKILVQKRLARAQKLEALGTLAGGIAHEINQPLNALRLYASGLEMLVEDKQAIDQDTLCERLNWILKEADKIRDIITHMRTLVRQNNSGTPGEADLNDCVRQALSLLKAQLAAHGITLQLNLTNALPFAKANPVQLEQVVINLVVNAMQALDTVEATQTEKILKIQTCCDSKDILLQVEDNGPGIAGVEEKIFDPFFTSKEPGAGMGMGLAIVHAFVSAWHGEIRVWNNQTKGATFSVRLNHL